MTTVKTFVGPLVPEHIQHVRDLRRKQETAPAQQSSYESSDDDIGPQLPVAEESDADALERMRQRELADQDGEPQSSLGSDRANWMSVALGGPTNDNINYNPKTFRRNITVQIDKSWTETQAERSKRQADEMMGIKTRLVSPPRKTVRRDNRKEDENEISEDERAAQPSLLEEHMARRAQQKQTDGQGKAFNWERDMKGGRGGSNSKVTEFVNQARSMNDKFARGSQR